MIRSDQQSQNMSKMSELQNGSCKLVFDNLTAVWLYRYISGCTAAHDRDEIFRKKYSGLYKSRPRLAKERLTIWKRKKQIFIQISQPKGFSEIFCVPHRSTYMRPRTPPFFQLLKYMYLYNPVIVETQYWWKSTYQCFTIQLWSQTSAQDVLKLSEKLFVLLIPASASERSVAHKIPLSLLHFVKQPSREGETRNPLVPTQ